MPISKTAYLKAKAKRLKKDGRERVENRKSTKATAKTAIKTANKKISRSSGKGSPGKPKSAAHKAAISAALKKAWAKRRKATKSLTKTIKKTTTAKKPLKHDGGKYGLDIKAGHLDAKIRKLKTELREAKKGTNPKAAGNVKINKIMKALQSAETKLQSHLTKMKKFKAKRK